jgi:photosystem II stability/assembly factor-like uncharacterized protein
MKRLLSIGLVGVIALSMSFFALNTKKQQLLYKPFQHQLKNSSEGLAAEFAGAGAYYNLLRNNLATGILNPADVYNMYRQLDLYRTPMNKTSKTINWVSMGPDNIGGRTLALLVDKDTGTNVYAGAASGGLWVTKNGGGFWKQASVGAINQAVSTIAQNSDRTIFYGTGESFYGAAGYGNGNSGVIGRGIFKYDPSTGVTTQLTATDPASKSNGSSPYDQGNTWAYTYKIVVGANNTLYAGNGGGVYVSTDDGATWKAKNSGFSGSVSICTEMAVTPDGKTIYAVMQPSDYSSTQLYRIKDGETKWTLLAKNKFNGVGRALLALSPSQPSTLYISCAGTDERLFGIFRSDDNGDTWKTAVAGGSDFTDPFIQAPDGKHAQGDYDNTIIVDPSNPDRFFVGGVHFYMGNYSNGSSLPQWTEVASLGGFNYIHPDKHCMAFDAKSSIHVLYVGSDGGVAKSINDFSTSTFSNQNSVPNFKTVNRGYITTQFYAVYPSPLNINLAIGGTQDNGTPLVNKGGVTELSGYSIHGGDGGYTAISHLNPSVYFAESQYGSIQRSLDGISFANFTDKNVEAGDPPPFPFVTPFRLWEKEKYDTVKNINGQPVIDSATGKVVKSLDLHNTKLFITSYRYLYATTGALDFQGTPVFFRLSNYNGGFVSAACMEYTPDGNTVYVGGAAGGTGVLYRVSGLDKFRQWGADTSIKVFNPASFGIKTTLIGTFSGQTVTGIGVDNNDGSHIVVTLGNYGTSNHVQMSNNANDTSATPTFYNISGNLNTYNFPVYDAEIDMTDPARVVLATEVGVWSCDNVNTSPIQWTEQNTGLDRVPCFMLRQDTFNRVGKGPIFYVASHGRGFFKSEDLFRVGIDQADITPAVSTSVSIFPNPARELANISFNLPHSSEVNIEIYDLQGKQIESFHYGQQSQGSHVYQLNTQAYKPGSYIIHSYGKGFDKTSKLLVVK